MLSPEHITRTEHIAREDIALFLNACVACTGQREFYDTAEHQRVSMAFLHEYICGNYRRLYARTLAAGINHFNQAAILFNLLSTGKETPARFRDEENALIAAGLRGLPPQRAYKLLERLREERINNRRTRAAIRDFLAGRRDLSFDAIKYRHRVRSAARHAHLALPGELGTLLFDNWRRVHFTTPLLESFRKAHYAKDALYELPFSIAEGLAARHAVPRERFLKLYLERGQLTAGEALRLQDATHGRAELAPEKLPLTALVLWLLSRPKAERLAQTPLLAQVARATLRRLGALPLGSGKLALVLDSSYSASGSSEKKRRPLALAIAVHALLSAAHPDLRTFWTCPPADNQPLLATARGQTNLTERLLDAVETGAETVILVSDGVENDPPGVFARALETICTQIRPVTVLHLNPVFDAEQLAVRSLSPRAPAIGLRDAEDLATVLGFARYATGAATLAELEAYLAGRVAAFTTKIK